jgi:hypothetical protein
MKNYKRFIQILFVILIHCHVNAFAQNDNPYPMPPAKNPLLLEDQHRAHNDEDFGFNAHSLYPYLPIYTQLIISKRDYTLEEHFDVDSNLGHIGNIIQTNLSLRKNYAYYDQHGDLESSAYVRFFSLGTFLTSASTIDIYDANGKAIGLIEGSIFTTSPAKFYFYDRDNNLTGIAYLDNDRCCFTVYHAKHSKKVVAIFTRVFVRDVQDWWVVDIVDHEAIDYRVLATFGAFTVDTQAEYKEDL